MSSRSEKTISRRADLSLFTMRAPDMFCGGCIGAVEGAIRAIPGVMSVDADITSKNIDITYDPTQVTRDKIFHNGIFDVYGREFIEDTPYSP